SRELALRSRRFEAPGVNTLSGGAEPIYWQAAQGASVLDVDGNRYTDLTSGFGVLALGHRWPAIEAAVEEQSRQLVHCLGDLNGHPARVKLAEVLTTLAPMPEAQAYFAISGSDAVEIALKTALLSTGRSGILAFDGGYHGSTLGALAATGRPSFRQPFLPQLNPSVRHLPFGVASSTLREVLTRHSDIGAVIVEPIQGRAGVKLPPRGWLAELSQVAREQGALLIFDEILTGGGRTGPFFACEAEGVRPDLLCCGKAISGGYPIAAVLASRSVLAAWPDDGEALHTATFLAHPVACAAALAAIGSLQNPAVRATAGDRTDLLSCRLGDSIGAHPEIVAIRGRGLLWGIELSTPGAAVTWAQAARNRGVLVLPSGAAGNVLELLPPFTISRPQLEDALDRLLSPTDGDTT
ncbi:MAG: aspartate aminotransferase family protein, partial [Thermoanaerobaculia bacterium]|nr:aspartate aminotransferase family protein [Thermoanaerobaculia bacterium]